MGIFANPIGQFICVCLGLMLVAMNILDVVIYRYQRDILEQKEIIYTHKTPQFVAVIILLLVGFELAAWATSSF